MSLIVIIIILICKHLRVVSRCFVSVPHLIIWYMIICAIPNNKYYHYYLYLPLVEKFDHSGCTFLTRISSTNFDIVWEYAKKLKLNLVLAVVFVLVFVLESTETEVSNVPPVLTFSAECLVFLLLMLFIFTYDVPHFLCCYTRASTLGKWLHYSVLFQAFCSLKRSVKNIYSILLYSDTRNLKCGV